MKESYLKEEDVIRVSVPLFIRLLEYVKWQKDITDTDIHFMAENLITLCERGYAMGMAHFTSIIPEDKIPASDKPATSKQETTIPE